MKSVFCVTYQMSAWQAAFKKNYILYFNLSFIKAGFDQYEPELNSPNKFQCGSGRTVYNF
jgi:hypothetical protein